MKANQKVILASGNTGKLREISLLLAQWDVVPQSDYDFLEAEETGLSFIENAILKARHACQHTGLPAIADDSGLEVDALNGQPGIYSARYAGDEAEDQDNVEKLLTNMQGVKNRQARFRCVLVYMRHQYDPCPLVCSGRWEGEIALAPRGKNGFGYDPIFYLADLNKTAAELSGDEKNSMSHRGQALALLKHELHSDPID